MRRMREEGTVRGPAGIRGVPHLCCSWATPFPPLSGTLLTRSAYLLRRSSSVPPYAVCMDVYSFTAASTLSGGMKPPNW